MSVKMSRTIKVSSFVDYHIKKNKDRQRDALLMAVILIRSRCEIKHERKNFIGFKKGGKSYEITHIFPTKRRL